MEEKSEPEEIVASAPEISPVDPVWPPPIDSPMYSQSATSSRAPRRFSFTSGLLLPFVLGIVFAFASSGPAPPAFYSISPAIVSLVQFLALNAVAYGIAFALRKVFQTNILEFGIGMLVSIAMIGLICLYISR